MHALEDSFSAAHVDRDPHFADRPSAFLDADRLAHLRAARQVGLPGLHASRGQRRSRLRLRALGRPHQRRARLSRPSPPLRRPGGVPDRSGEGGGGHGRRLPGADVSVARPRHRRGEAGVALPAGAEQRRRAVAGLRTRAPAERGGGRRSCLRSHDSALPRPDVFVGAQGVVGAHSWGRGPLGRAALRGTGRRRSCSGSAAPAGSTGATASTSWRGTAQLSLLLPLVRRFTIGAAPAGLQLACDDALRVAARPTWWRPSASSWSRSATRPGWASRGRAGPGPSGRSVRLGFGLALGWSHEKVPRLDAAAPPKPSPPGIRPRPDEVSVLPPHPLDPRRLPGDDRGVAAPTTRSSASGSTGASIATAGIGAPASPPELQIEIDAGRIDGTWRAAAWPSRRRCGPTWCPIGSPSPRRRR